MNLPASGSICVKAPAKINLYLHVVGRRANGLHELESLIVFMEEFDILTLTPAKELGLEIAGTFAPGLSNGDDNLVLRAARALGEKRKANAMPKEERDARRNEAKRAKRAEEELKATTAAKEAIEKLQQAGVAKLAVHERQLKTFFEANEALEADLLKQVQRAAALERRKVELEAEQQTIEAYYQARLDEMQAQ